MEANLHLLADYVIETHFPHLLLIEQDTGQDGKYAAWYAEVVASTAKLVARWQALGF